MKLRLLLPFLVLSMELMFAQNIAGANEVALTKISENTYIHTYARSNGLIYKDNNEAIIVSTPPSDDATKELINRVKSELKVTIIGYVIDRWHPDAMEGLDVVKSLGIKTYSSELTREIAKKKGLPIPEVGFDEKLEISVGDEKVICHYLGEAHTTDGIVVWVPKEKVLFGGNEIRNYNGWVGNIAEANLKAWSTTVGKIKERYGSAKVVVPGHGNYGGKELIDYTIGLYTPNKWGAILRKHDIRRERVFNDFDKIYEVAEGDSTDGETRYLRNAIVFIDNKDRYIMVTSPSIRHTVKEELVASDYGRLRIYSKEKGGAEPNIDLYYNRLIVRLRNDEVGIEIVLREML